MEELQKKLGYEFKDKSLLKKALKHSSYANENKSEGECNERLEFLGDSVLGFSVATYLYKNYPNLPEGKMTRLRSEMVCEENLAKAAKELDLGEKLLLGKGEEKGGGRNRPSISADAMEAVIAAIFLDSGYDEADRLINDLIISNFVIDDNALLVDYKTRLQELVQRKAGQHLVYEEMGEEGPDHDKVFTVAAVLNGETLAVGVGKSKKIAEQDAAKAALGKLK
ncbi:MAG: ribonuclease III [Oscillospiraceae bacterium]|nr:ribonuclease III [Oscillospiraceae bacterium]